MNPVTKVRQMLSSRRLAGRSRGQMLVVISVALVALLGAVALCADIGVFYYNWAQLQKCVDNAALAGANYLPDNTNNQAVTTAQNYVTINGRPGDTLLNSTIIPNYPVGATTVSAIRVQVKRPAVSYLFARILGATSGSIIAEATAGALNAGSCNGFIPLGAQCAPTGSIPGPGCQFTTCAAGQTCTNANKIQLNVSIPNTNPATQGELNFPGANNGGGNLRTQIDQTIAGSTYSPGDSMPVKPGGTVGPVNQGVADRTKRSTCSTGGTSVCWDDVPTDSRVVLIPLVDFTGVVGRTPGTMVGYVCGWLLGSSGGTVSAYVIQSTCGGCAGSTTGSNTGAFAATLLK